MTSKTLKDMRKELLDKYSGKLTGYEHLADGTGEYAKSARTSKLEKQVSALQKKVKKKLRKKLDITV